jgi:hypothetical protein
MCFVVSAVASVVLGVACYLAIASINFVSADPFSIAVGSLVLAGVAAVVTIGVILTTLVLTVVRRPRVVGLFVLLSSVAFPVVALVVGVTFGVHDLEANVNRDARQVTGIAGHLIDLVTR